MKRVFIILIAMLLAGCGATTSVKKDQSLYTPTLKLDATFRIENWNTHKTGENWIVNIFFEMENKGNVQIAYYEVYFSIRCEDGSTALGDGWGPTESLEKAYEGKVGDPVLPGEKSRGLGGAMNCTSKPVSVEVTTWKLHESR